MAYMLGRKPPKDAPALLLSSILATELPAHPVEADYLNLEGWQMLGNDQYGDCVAVTWANERRLLTHQAGAENYPGMEQVTEFYKTQNPGFPNEDNGMEIQTALEELVKNGGPDGVKALAFAKVDVNNLEEVKAALAIFGCLWTGIVVQSAQMQQFDQNQPWDYVRNSPEEGGHSVISGGYDGDNVAGDVRFITWAEETSFTDSYWNKLTEEAWVVIWPEHLDSVPFQEGIDLAQLADDYTAITGRPFPVQPEPSPTPDPNPSPTPTPQPSPDVDQALAELAVKYIEHKRTSAEFKRDFKSALQNWLDTHDLGS